MRKLLPYFLSLALIFILVLGFSSCGIIDGLIGGKDTAHTHNYEIVDTYDATCTEPGYQTYVCDCGDWYDKSIDTIEHSYITEVTPPTCTEEGYTTYTCSDCGYSYTANEIVDLNAHDYYLDYISYPDCRWNGYTVYSCWRCGHSYTTDEVAALGHSWMDADCVTAKTCSVCGDTEGEANGHKWVSADCVTGKTCSVCGETEGGANGHSWTDADCVNAKTCSVCGETEGDANGHSWIGADCVTAKTCSVCGETEGDANGHSWIDADCVTAKTCSVCGETEGEANGHSWTGVDYVTAKTCCSVCGTLKPSENLGYSLSSDGTYYTVTGIGECTDVNVIIPATYNNLPVKGIGNSAFSDCSSLISVTIPDSITYIGEFAFYDCSSLTSVTIGNGVKTIYTAAFYGCSSITSITISNSIKSIWGSAFEDCSSLTSVTIGNSVTSIGDRAFIGCNKLVEVINKSSLNLTLDTHWSSYGCVTSSAKEIHDGESKIINKNDYLFYTFEDVNYLLGYKGKDTELILPDNYNGQSYDIYRFAFYGCSNLTSITIPDSVTSIGDYAFKGCSSLVNVTIPDSVTSIAGSAFDDCSNLTYNEYDNACYLGNDRNPYIILVKAKSKDITSCTIYENTKFIYPYAFKSCSGLESIAIPDNVISIPSSAFDGCSSLIYNEYDNACYLGNDNNPYIILVKAKSKDITSCTIYENTKFIYPYAFDSCSRLTSITIPESVTSIDGFTFYGCSSLESVTIPDSVTSIGYSAFEGCSSLESVTIPDSVTSIISSAFYGCSSLTSITIPDSVTSIDYQAFRGCSSLKSITIPNSVTSIIDWGLALCSSLKSINYDGTVKEWEAISKGDYWDNGTGAYTIYCTDGEITNFGKVTYY